MHAVLEHLVICPGEHAVFEHTVLSILSSVQVSMLCCAERAVLCMLCFEHLVICPGEHAVLCILSCVQVSMLCKACCAEHAVMNCVLADDHACCFLSCTCTCQPRLLSMTEEEGGGKCNSEVDANA